MKIYNSIAETIGGTPLIRLTKTEKLHSLKAQLIIKAESFNPGGSAKDRVGLEMVLDAEHRGILQPGGTIIEPTSGNTGIGLAVMAAVKDYKLIITMPDTMSVERQKLMAAYGAEIILTDGVLGMKGAIAKAEELAASIPNSFIAGQFENPANPAAHYNATGPELWADSDGKVDIFVAGIGTGGTITGTGRYLKERNPEIQVIGVEPADSPVLTEGRSGPHGLQGIGANFIPDVLDMSVVDRVMTRTTRQAYAAGRELAREEGILVGISSGAALSAGIELAKLEENRGKVIVVLLPDSGERYLSTDMFD
ncbi:MAG: cysteine synthase A [Ruminococcaceae bacterium]|nr:cysteine synthase A [Oscillospiraceae bacterium]